MNLEDLQVLADQIGVGHYHVDNIEELRTKIAFEAFNYGDLDGH